MGLPSVGCPLGWGWHGAWLAAAGSAALQHVAAGRWLGSVQAWPRAGRRRATLLILPAQKCSAQGILMDL